ncbi:MAG: hypothetical protein AAGJ34_00055 [Pseudomonadota bacterium]
MLRYPLSTDWPIYLFILAYATLILRMTYGLWFGDGINIFASYSTPTDPAQVIVDANKVYWSKTCFLFGTLLLVGLGVDFRAAVGLAALFWSGSLILMFGMTFTLGFTLVLAAAIFGLQVYRAQLFN